MNHNWLDRTEYPFEAHYFECEGHKLHYIDEGQGEVLLFVHGTPSWSFDFRYQIKALSKRFRCIALDHLGFGLSEKPENHVYTTLNHAENLQKLIHFLGLKNINLIVHDFGGIIGLYYALHFPQNIQKIVLLNTRLWDCSQEENYQKLRGILKSPLLPFLYKYLNFSPKFLLPQSFFNKKILSSSIKKHYTAPFANIQDRKGTLAFAKSLLNDQAWFGTLWEKRSVLQEKSFLLIWGMNDNFVTPSYLATFAAAFPHKTVVELANCGHFPQEEKKEEVLKALENFFLL